MQCYYTIWSNESVTGEKIASNYIHVPFLLQSSTFQFCYQALLGTGELEMLHFYIRSQTPWGWALPSSSLVTRMVTSRRSASGWKLPLWLGLRSGTFIK